MLRWRYYILLLLFIQIAEKTQAQQRTIFRGFVTDSEKSPLTPAVVRFFRDTASLPVFFTMTNEKGGFEYPIPSESKIAFVQISMVGYYSKWIKLDTVYWKALKVILVRSDIDLPEVDVIANPKMEIRGDTTAYLAAAYKKGNENNVGDLLKQIPGFEVLENGKVKYNGKIIDRILIENDDLFGKGRYGLVTNNIGIGGIEKIEVIKNFKDNSNLANTLSAGNEQVINIRFKNNRFNKVFGNTQGAQAPGANRSEWKTDIIGLIPKSKFVLLTNRNTIGITGEHLKSATESGVTENVDNVPYSLPELNTFFNTPGFLQVPIDQSYVLDNTTFYQSVNSLIKASPTLNFNINYHYYKDQLRQSYFSTRQFFNNTGILQILENGNLFRSNGNHEVSLKTGYFVTKRFQLIQQSNFTFSDQQGAFEGFFQEKDRQQYTNSSKKKISNKAEANYLINPKSLVNLSVEYHSGNLPEKSSLLPFENDVNFQFSRQPESFYQYGEQDNKSFVASAGYQLKNKTITHGFHVGLLNAKTKNQSNGFALDSQHFKEPLPSTFGNNFRFTQQQLWFSYAVNKEIGKRVFLNFTVNPTFQTLKVLGYSIVNNSAAERKFLVPFNFSARFAFNQSRSLMYTYSSSVRLPYLEQLNQGNLFANYRTILKGSDTISSGMRRNYSIVYFDIDPVIKQRFIYMFLMYSVSDINYMRNINNQLNYSFSNWISRNQVNKTWLFFLSMTKQIAKTPLNTITELNYNRSSGNMMLLNNKLQLTSMRSAMAKLQLKSMFKGAINFATGIKLSSTKQFADYNNGVESVWTTKSASITSELNLRINKTVNIDLPLEYNIIYPSIGSSRTVFLTDIVFKYQVIKEKLQVGLTLKNLFNKTAYTSSEINSLFNTTTSVGLISRYGLASIKWQF